MLTGCWRFRWQSFCLFTVIDFKLIFELVNFLSSPECWPVIDRLCLAVVQSVSDGSIEGVEFTVWNNVKKLHLCPEVWHWSDLSVRLSSAEDQVQFMDASDCFCWFLAYTVWKNKIIEGQKNTLAPTFFIGVWQPRLPGGIDKGL